MKILVGTGNGGGNIPPLVALLRKLTQRGHTVRVLLGPLATGRPVAEYLRPRFEEAGCEVMLPDGSVWSEGAQPIPGDGEIPAEYPRIWGMARFATVAAPWAVQIARDIETSRPDLIIVDFHVPGAAIGAEAAGMPIAVISMSVTGHRPMEGIPIAPENPHFEDRKAYERAGIDHILSRLNPGRAAVGLAPDAGPWDWEERAIRELYLTSPAFDFTPDPMPDRVRITGSLIPESGSQGWDDPWPGDERPLVLISPTTTLLAQLSEKVVGAAAGAVAGMPVRGLFTLGRIIDPKTLPAAENIVYTDFVPHSAVLPHVAAIVSQCGHGTTMAALRGGVPLVCFPKFGDQQAVAARVARHGAGIVLSDDPEPTEVRRALEAVLGDPSYRDAARKLSVVLRQEDGATVAANEIEAVALG